MLSPASLAPRSCVGYEHGVLLSLLAVGKKTICNIFVCLLLFVDYAAVEKNDLVVLLCLRADCTVALGALGNYEAKLCLFIYGGSGSDVDHPYPLRFIIPYVFSARLYDPASTVMDYSEYLILSGAGNCGITL